MNFINKLALFVFSSVCTFPLKAQNDGGISLHGSIQSDILIPENDEKIGTGKTNEDFLTNTYLDLNLLSKYVDAGARLEYLEHPLPGFESDFKGWGVPHIYIKGKFNGGDVTIGDFYEQFGSGFILRTYEERSLGIDNSIRGIRTKYNGLKGFQLTALGGVQRIYWDWDTDTWIYGVNAEVNIDEYSERMRENNITWMLGGSWVLKNEKSEVVSVPGTNYRLNVPENVNAFDLRSRLQMNNFSILGEYAWKTQDPSALNGYTYHSGNALMLSASYSKTGLSALIQAKRSEDMAFRSKRTPGINAMDAGYIICLSAYIRSCRTISLCNSVRKE